MYGSTCGGLKALQPSPSNFFTSGSCAPIRCGIQQPLRARWLASVRPFSISTNLTSISNPNIQSAASMCSRKIPWTIQRPARNFHSSPRRLYKTVQQARSRYRIGPFSIASVVIFLSTGFGMLFYFRYEKERMERKRIAEHSKGVGRPKVGGPFELVDQNGQPFSSDDIMKGRFSLVYFGFTHCPDICPEELDKMSSMIDLVSAAFPPTTSNDSRSKALTLLPLFITCDPARDTPSVLKAYLQEFHPSMIGLTGTWEQMKAVCKSYRVYFSTPEGVKPGMDYLVDHSIYFYLMDPEGDFVEAIGRQHTAEQAARIIINHMNDWKRDGKAELK